jgi:alkylhydroperoxidase/carboxymuconolactone decarboxylase family protein YurZ
MGRYLSHTRIFKSLRAEATQGQVSTSRYACNCFRYGTLACIKGKSISTKLLWMPPVLAAVNPLTAGERELIATYVSSEIAAASLGDNEAIVKKVKHDFEHAEISEKLKALLVIAGLVQRGGKQLTTEAVARARDLGATDLEIHDTVLIAAAFCMFNRYVDGLATTQPRDEAMYRERGKRIAREGYINISKEYIPAEIAD